MGVESRDLNGTIKKWYIHLTKSGKILGLTFGQVKEQLLGW
jgi:hypothetical protein